MSTRWSRCTSVPLCESNGILIYIYREDSKGHRGEGEAWCENGVRLRRDIQRSIGSVGEGWGGMAWVRRMSM